MLTLELERNQRTERSSRQVTEQNRGFKGNGNHGERRRRFHLGDGGAGELQWRKEKIIKARDHRRIGPRQRLGWRCQRNQGRSRQKQSWRRSGESVSYKILPAKHVNTRSW